MPSWEGLILTVGDSENPPASALLLKKEFKKAGFDMALEPRTGLTVHSGTNSELDLFNLRVGENPKLRRSN